jgi:hypothetical protein
LGARRSALLAEVRVRATASSGSSSAFDNGDDAPVIAAASDCFNSLIGKFARSWPEAGMGMACSSTEQASQLAAISRAAEPLTHTDALASLADRARHFGPAEPADPTRRA